MTDQPPPQPPSNDRVVGWLNAVKGLTLTNVLVIAGLVLIAIPAYTVYKALGDDKLLDRLLSTYEEIASQQSSCTIRHVQARGGPELWGISAGFAFAGSDRWFVNVVLTHDPSGEEIVSYCETLKLIADSMLDRGGDDAGADDDGEPFQHGGGGPVQRGSMPRVETDGSEHPGMPDGEEAE